MCVLVVIRVTERTSEQYPNGNFGVLPFQKTKERAGMSKVWCVRAEKDGVLSQIFWDAKFLFKKKTKPFIP